MTIQYFYINVKYILVFQKDKSVERISKLKYYLGERTKWTANINNKQN